MHLKDILCQVDPNTDKLHDGLLLFKPVVWKLQFGTYVPSGEEESIPLLLADSRPVVASANDPKRTLRHKAHLLSKQA